MAGTGNHLGLFLDFVEATGSTYLGGESDFINEAGKRTYFMAKAIQGQEILKGGRSVRENIVFQDNGTFGFHKPGAKQDWVNPQRLHKVESFFRYSMAHAVYVDQEILQNEVITKGTSDHRYRQIVKLRDEKMGVAWTTKWNGMENANWAVPNKAIHEGEGDEQMDAMPILAVVNEDANGLWGENYTGHTWTTVFGVDPTAASVNGRYTPQQETYANITINDPDNVIAGIERLFRKCHFEQPPTMKEYFEDPKYGKQDMISSSKGLSIYNTLLRAGQDRFVAGQQDPSYNKPLFKGVPLTYNDDFGVGTYYDDGSNGVTHEGAADLIGPRFILLNWAYYFPFFHEERYCEVGERSRHHNYPETWVIPIATWYNWICPSRRRLGFLSPSADVVAAYTPTAD
jgi:hypothetical protein